MTSPAFLGALCLALSCLGGAHGFWRSDDLEWSKLIMVHHWPATVCQEVARHCKDPPNYWTIHGLWPDKSEACNRSWPFNPHEIKDLLPDMKMYWPDLLHPSNCSLQFCSAHKESACNAGDPGLIPGSGRSAREGIPALVFCPGEFHGLYSPWGRKESDTTERLSLSRFPLMVFLGPGDW